MELEKKNNRQDAKSPRKGGMGLEKKMTAKTRSRQEDGAGKKRLARMCENAKEARKITINRSPIHQLIILFLPQPIQVSTQNNRFNPLNFKCAGLLRDRIEQVN